MTGWDDYLCEVWAGSPEVVSKVEKFIVDATKPIKVYDS